MSFPQEAGGEYQQAQVLARFEKYLGAEPLPITNSKNLLPSLRAIDKPEAQELADNLVILHHFELPKDGHTRRDVVLMEDREGNQSIVVVCRDTRLPTDQDFVYGNLKVIGGMGRYPTPAGRNPLEYALEHTKLLSAVMARKTEMAGLQEKYLAGMKGTIPGESDWNKSKWLKIATGFLFSPSGPFADAMTGTDAGITPDDIILMAKGSKIGGNHQIAGTIEAFDTPGSSRHSAGAVLDVLANPPYKQYFKDRGFQVPVLDAAAIASVEGFGRIGRTLARLMLNKGMSINISDILLDEVAEDFAVFGRKEELIRHLFGRENLLKMSIIPEEERTKLLEFLLRSSEVRERVEALDQVRWQQLQVAIQGANVLSMEDAQAFQGRSLDENKLYSYLGNAVNRLISQQFLLRKANEMVDQNRGIEIKLVKTVDLPKEQADIYCPCSSAEGSLTKNKLIQLCASEVRVILSGANNPFGKDNIWQKAKLASELGILMPPEILANCGSVTAAAMEPLFRAELQRLSEKYPNLSERDIELAADVFVDLKVVPHVQQNTREKMASLIEIMKETGVDMYTAGEIFFYKVHGVKYEVRNGIVYEIEKQA